MPESEWPHIIFFAETWFTDGSDVNIKDYQIHRLDRSGRGGGVAIYFRRDIAVLDMAAQIPQLAEARVDDDNPSSSLIEQVWAVIEYGEERFLVGSMYRPHDRNDAVLDKITTIITTATNSLPKLNCSAMLLFGDFNFSHTSYELLDVGGVLPLLLTLRTSGREI